MREISELKTFKFGKGQKMMCKGKKVKELF